MDAAEFDYVVVGCGSSGAAVAARLGERADRTTCVIEAGGHDSHPFIHIPSFVAAAIGREATNWRFATVPQPGMAGRAIPVPHRRPDRPPDRGSQGADRVYSVRRGGAGDRV